MTSVRHAPQTRRTSQPGKPVPPPARTGPRSPTAPQLKVQARANSRRHVGKTFARILALLAADLTTVVVAKLLLDFVRHSQVASAGPAHVLGTTFSSGYLNAWQFGAAVVLGLVLTGNYGPADSRRSPHRLLIGVIFATGLQLWSSLWTVAPETWLARYVGTVVAFGVLLIAMRLLVDQLIRRLYRRRNATARVLLVGKKNDCEQILDRFHNGEIEAYQVVDIVHTDAFGGAGGVFHIQPTDELEHLIHAHRIDTAVICGYPGREAIMRTMKAAMASECQVLSWNPNLDVVGLVPTLLRRDGQPLLEWRAPTLRWWQFLLKRMIDIVLSGLGMLALAPLFFVIAVLIRRDGPGPIVFGHGRLGRFGQVFRCYKFRSMYPDAEERLRSDPELYAEYVRNDYKLPPEKDTRITPIGRFLRKTSLDELPQLWNVFIGDMSLVGPRPIVPDELRHYDRESLLFLSLRPGMTGAWQVGGRSSVAYPERTLIELDYVQQWSLLRDIGIIFRTIPAVLVQRGAH